VPRDDKKTLQELKPFDFFHLAVTFANTFQQKLNSYKLLLDKKAETIIAKKQVGHHFKRSLFAFSLFVISLCLNLPPYFLPIDSYNLLLTLSLVSFLCIVLAIILVVKNLISWFKNKSIRRGLKNYFAFSLNVLIVLVTTYTIILWVMLAIK
jgi:hypothetical protein